MPAPLPPAPGTVRVVVTGTWSTATRGFAHVFHAEKGDGSSWAQSELDQLTTALSATTGTGNPLLAIVTNQRADMSYTSVSATELTATGLTSSKTMTIPGTLSTTASPQLPWSTALCTSWVIGRRVRGGHPRTYWSGITSDQLVSGVGPAITGGYLTSWRTQAELFRTRFNAIVIGTSVAVFGCLSYYDKATNPTPPHLRTTPVFFPASAAKVHSRLDTQRRRLGKEAA